MTSEEKAAATMSAHPPKARSLLHARALVAGAVAIVAWALTPISASDRLIRRFDHRDGLPVSSVFALGQDSHGFLWIGTGGGLVRYDGLEMRLWSGLDVSGIVDRIFTGPRGEVLFRVSGDDRLYRVAGGDVEPLEQADRPLEEVRDAAFDARGDLWIAHGGRVVRREGERPALELPVGAMAGERPRRLHPGGEGGMLVATDAGVWRVGRSNRAEKLLTLRGIIDIQPHPGGSLFLLRYDLLSRWELVEWSGGRLLERFQSRERAIDLALRGDAIWASFSRDLVVWRPAAGIERLGPNESFGGTGGPMLVDAEGSLWMGGFLGLFHFPEPGTVIWTERDGLPSRHTRFFARTPEGLWVATWSGLARLEQTPAGMVAHLESPTGRTVLCVDGQGRLWTQIAIDEGTSRLRTGQLERSSDRTVIHEYPRALIGRCTTSADGTVWLSLGDTLLRTAPEGGRPREVATVPGIAGHITALAESRDGTLWAGTVDGVVCHATIVSLAASADWTCERLPRGPQVKRLVETSSGTIWVATTAGLLRRTGGEWEQVPGSRELPSEWMSWACSSPAGGVWITGHGFVMRVGEDPDPEAGWEVLERIGVWQGLPTSGAEGVLEDEDGTLWLATSAGVVRISAEARARKPEPPPVRLVDVRVDDERLPLGERADLPHERNRLEISFAALSYRDPSRIRYRVRPRPGARWSESRLPAFRFVDLPPGEYRPEVIASLDGVRWSAEPASFAFRIRAPWYRQTWALALWIVLIAAALYAVYRARMAVMLRLERQRTRIAMDLHDEMGSGLGSIGILADLARQDEVEPAEKTRIVSQISDTASELAGSLGDIVWSLRGHSASIEALATQLAERGGRMFPDGAVRFTTQFPERWPDTPLGLAVRRNLQRIGVEALHNAAKHAGASRVRLGFAADRSRWRMWVEDDGRGLRSEGSAGRRQGLGLTSMRTRAAEIGAEISWSEPAGGGTRVEVRFDPRASGRGHTGRPA